jgi:hypothetical protein
MSGAILNQPWEDVADDVTGAIEKAVQPLLKQATDSIYAGLLDATQDYLRDNLAFNIASRIAAAEREAANDREELERERLIRSDLLEALETATALIRDAEKDTNWVSGDPYGDSAAAEFEALIAKARGAA